MLQTLRQIHRGVRITKQQVEKCIMVDAVKDEQETDQQLMENVFRMQKQRGKGDFKALVGSCAMVGSDFRKYAELLDETLLSVPFSDPTLHKVGAVHGFLAEGDARSALLQSRGLIGECNRYLLQDAMLYAHTKCPAVAKLQLGFVRDARARRWQRFLAGKASNDIMKDLRALTKAPTRRLIGSFFVPTVVPFLKPILNPRSGGARAAGGSLPAELMHVVDVMLSFGMTFGAHTVRVRVSEDEERSVQKARMEPPLESLGLQLQWNAGNVGERSGQLGSTEMPERDMTRVATSLAHERVERAAARQAARDGVAYAPKSRVQQIKEAQEKAEKALKDEEKDVPVAKGMKDYFIITRARKRALPDRRANKVFVEINYQEGHTSAVRRPVFVRDFFRLGEDPEE